MRIFTKTESTDKSIANSFLSNWAAFSICFSYRT